MTAFCRKKSWEQVQDTFPSGRFFYKRRLRRLLFVQLRSHVKGWKVLVYFVKKEWLFFIGYLGISPYNSLTTIYSPLPMYALWVDDN
jgi:hypothetical protein